jgi:hypothetical protein
MNHCEVVKGSMTGKRDIDEQTLTSVEVLNDRLERIKKLGQKYSRIEFSPDVRRLKSHSNRIVPV